MPEDPVGRGAQSELPLVRGRAVPASRQHVERVERHLRAGCGSREAGSRGGRWTARPGGEADGIRYRHRGGGDPRRFPEQVRDGPADRGNFLDRMLFTATRYPADYGFVADALGEDGTRSTPWSSSASPPSPAAGFGLARSVYS